MRRNRKKYICGSCLFLTCFFCVFLSGFSLMKNSSSGEFVFLRTNILLSGEYGRNGQADLLEIPQYPGQDSFSVSKRRGELNHINSRSRLQNYCFSGTVFTSVYGVKRKKTPGSNLEIYFSEKENPAVQVRAGPFFM